MAVNMVKSTDDLATAWSAYREALARHEAGHVELRMAANQGSSPLVRRYRIAELGGHK